MQKKGLTIPGGESSMPRLNLGERGKYALLPV